MQRRLTSIPFLAGLKSSSHSFYHTATLRGICEDIIVLKAINGIPPKDRSQLVAHLQMADLFESIKNQTKFFHANRPQQPIIATKDADNNSKAEAARVLEIYDKYGFVQNGRKPSVRKLAIRANLWEVYEFFYSATSKWVHFSPQILMRMGWAPKKASDAVFTFSTAHFSNYYAGFNAVYGTYLFGLFYEFFGDEMGLDPKAGKYVAELGMWIGSLSRWPEVITFEELNIEQPNPIVYEVMKLVAERKAKKKRAT